MATLGLGQAEFSFQSEGLPTAALRVHHFCGRESLSEPFEFLIELVCTDSSLDLDAPISKPACLTLRGRRYDGSRYTRYIHGVIERFVHLASGVRASHYSATLVPSIHPMRFTRTSRIFQNLSMVDVTLQVLKDDKISSDMINPLLHNVYTPRDFCVQYQESDLNFVQRLWEEEGVFYFFEHSKDKDVLTLGDGNYAYEKLPEYSTVTQRDQPHLYEEGIFEFRSENMLRPGASLMRDFKFKQPGLDMEVTAQADKFSEYKIYHFPGQYVDPEVGKRLVKVRLEQEQWQRLRYFGSGNVRAMAPGYTFTLAGSRRVASNQEYLIVAVDHEGSQPQALGEEAGASESTVYQNRIECISSKVAFRPPMSAEQPSIPGVQTAAVVGPPGEEIHCDEHGRVRVQFPWDRQGKKDDHSSCWIRVSQPWGGVAYGGVFLPRIGQEVLVQFIEGDPDRPVIIGRVYNGENPLPYPLPAHKTVSTFKSASSPGGNGSNELRFEDAAGREEIYLHGQLDMNTVIERDRTQRFGRDTTDSVGRDRTRNVARNETISIGADRTSSVGGNETLSVSGNQTLSVGANQDINIAGNQQEQVSKSRATHVKSSDTLHIDGGQAITIGSAQTLQVRGDQTLQIKAGQTIEVTGPISIKSASEIKLACGAGSITIEQSGNIIIKGPLVKINC